jgi:hypothetical protein
MALLQILKQNGITAGIFLHLFTGLEKTNGQQQRRKTTGAEDEQKRVKTG